MAALLDAMQPDRVVALVADDETDHLGIERAAGLEVARGEHQMAGAGDVERRIVIGLRMRHRHLLFNC